ncbi:MAG: acyl-CoA thioesterase [Bacteroidales bacterium]|jgi:acyl-CoA thioester hydrolase|nr:acyl-CoA thioesterase [Bacteroidales bacterium]
MIELEYKHRILYADTDAMGVVYYANYLRIYEAARADFLDQIKTPISAIMDYGIIMPVIKVQVDYILPAQFDWIIRVVTRIEKLPMAKLVVYHEMYSPENVLLNKATITLSFVDNKTFRAVRCPEWIIDNIKKYI